MAVRKITTAIFEQEILQDKGTALADFYADWCGPCKALAPVLEEVADEISVDIVKINVDEEPLLTQKYGIMSVPTLILFRDGQAVRKLIGQVGKEEIKEIL